MTLTTILSKIQGNNDMSLTQLKISLSLSLIYSLEKIIGSINEFDRYFIQLPKLYIPSNLNIDLILWHPQFIVDAVKC